MDMKETFSLATSRLQQLLDTGSMFHVMTGASSPLAVQTRILQLTPRSTLATVGLTIDLTFTPMEFLELNGLTLHKMATTTLS